MPNFPIRGVGATGIITDQSPYDLDLSGWSSGRNVRFSGGSVSRYSLFKDAYPLHIQDHASADKIPVGGGIFLTPSTERVFVVRRDLSVVSPNADGTEVTYTPAAVPSASSLRCTTAFVGGVTYLNREDNRLLYMTPVSSQFTPVSSWDSTYRAASVRPFGDYLIGMNVTKAGVANPNLFKWTDTIQYGTVADFNLATPGTNAGEDVLNDAQSGIVDGWPLRDAFIMYTSTDVYLVNYIGGDFIFSHDRLFSDDGVMSVNCVVEVENKHFVFGTQDIYVHDGVTKQSITDGRIKKYLYKIINFAAQDRCFVYHDAEHSEVGFAFNTLIDEATVSPSEDANFAAVYNYGSNTWTFVDIPSGVVSLRLGINSASIWSEMDASWETLDASWTAFSGSSSKLTTLISAGYATSETRPRFAIMDDALTGRLSSAAIDDYRYTAFVERTGLDMDNLGAEIMGRKLLKRILPQVRTTDTESLFYVQLGRGRFSGSSVIWDAQKPFNPTTMYKIDTRNTGRYLAMRFEAPDGYAFELSGYDVDMVQISRR